MTSDSSGKRVTRYQEKMKVLEDTNRAKLQSTDFSHQGFDTTSLMKTAHKSSKQGSLDDTVRWQMHGQISSGSVRSNSITDVTPSFTQDALNALRNKKASGNIVQQEVRIKPHEGGSYEGHLVTVSRVVNHGDVADDKEIGHPKSPHPDNTDIQYDRAHRAPFSLTGAESNKYSTVWAPHYPNIAVDSHMERKALDKFKKYGDNNVFYVAADTHDRSSVGVVYDRGDSEKVQTGGKPRFKSVFANYERKF
ncbi:hypothetical protein [Chitinolyticbacter meiyuanensis]|uniref:hypothetical protein n=1 Tax=Chitinolyticbacter meiyuanensis TaxID=682798 RepID=UPI0011E5D689|nr:hypothetical protein [Chitinolyticbacter meiyuanensis]